MTMYDTTIYFETNSVDTSFVFNSTNNFDTFYIENTNTKIYRYFDTLKVITTPIKDSVIITKQVINLENKESTKSKIKDILVYAGITIGLLSIIFISIILRIILK